MSEFPWYTCSCGLRVTSSSMHFLECATVAKRVREYEESIGEFSEEAYAADPARIIAHAVSTGRALVVRKDGSVRVAISIPSAELDKDKES